MPHVAVEVDRLADIQDDRVIEFGEHLDAPLEDVDVFLARMVHEIAELFSAAGVNARQYGDHALPAQFRAQVVVIIIAGVDAHRVLEPADAAARSHRRFRRGRRIRKHLRDADVEPLAQLHQLVVGEREAIVLDLRQGRHRYAGALAHFLECPALSRPECAQQAAEGGMACAHVLQGLLPKKAPAA